MKIVIVCDVAILNITCGLLSAYGGGEFGLQPTPTLIMGVRFNKNFLSQTSKRHAIANLNNYRILISTGEAIEQVGRL